MFLSGLGSYAVSDTRVVFVRDINLLLLFQSHFSHATICNYSYGTCFL